MFVVIVSFHNKLRNDAYYIRLIRENNGYFETIPEIGRLSRRIKYDCVSQ